MGLTSAQLDVVDLTPGIGSEIRTDIDTLLSGGEAERIRAILAQRGVVFFRGLEISDEHQVAIAKTLGNIVKNEGEDGIYKISLDKNVNQRAEYLKGSLFWHFDGSFTALSESRHPAARDETVGDRGRYRILQHLCGIRRPAGGRQRTHRRPSGGAQCRAVAVLRDTRNELRGNHLLAKVPDEGLPDGVDPPIRAQVTAARRDRRLRHRAAGGGKPRIACPPSRLGHTTAVRLSAPVATRRPAHLGQHRHHAPRAALRGRQRPPHAPHHSGGRGAPPVKLGITTPVVTNVAGGALTWEKDASIEDIGRVAETAD